MNDAQWENLMETIREGFAGRETARMIDKERDSLKEEIILLTEDLCYWTGLWPYPEWNII